MGFQKLSNINHLFKERTRNFNSGMFNYQKINRRLKMSDINKLADEIINSGKVVIDAAKGIHGVDGAVKIIPGVIAEVELAAQKTQGMTSAEKKELAINIINRLIDIPLIPESVEAMLLGYAIDAIVAALNKLVGKDWIKLA